MAGGPPTGSAGVRAGDHTDGMVEVITLLTAVVSAAAAAVSAWVAVAQWRENRAARAGGGAAGDAVLSPGGAGTRHAGDVDHPGGGDLPDPREPDGSRPGPGPRSPTDWVAPRSLDEPAGRAAEPTPAVAPSRTLAVASGVAAVCLALTAVALAGHALSPGDGQDGLAGAVLSVAMLLSVGGAGLATWVMVTRRSRTARDQRRAALAFAGSLAPWVALTVVDLVERLAG